MPKKIQGCDLLTPVNRSQLLLPSMQQRDTAPYNSVHFPEQTASLQIGLFETRPTVVTGQGNRACILRPGLWPVQMCPSLVPGLLCFSLLLLPLGLSLGNLQLPLRLSARDAVHHALHNVFVISALSAHHHEVSQHTDTHMVADDAMCKVTTRW